MAWADVSLYFCLPLRLGVVVQQGSAKVVHYVAKPPLHLWFGARGRSASSVRIQRWVLGSYLASPALINLHAQAALPGTLYASLAQGEDWLTAK